MEIKIEEAMERIEKLEEMVDWATNQIEYLRGWRDKMEKVYPVYALDEVLPESTYNKLFKFARKNKMSVNETLTTLIENGDVDKENKK